MKEKLKKYLHLIHSEKLIEGQLPKQSNLEKFEKWTKRLLQKNLKCS
ncbi:MAG: hypothetical protein IJA94_01470 [Bacilli bacterium]|nr:hypothetical protein [Bacilli bacterium]